MGFLINLTYADFPCPEQSFSAELSQELQLEVLSHDQRRSKNAGFDGGHYVPGIGVYDSGVEPIKKSVAKERLKVSESSLRRGS